MGFHLKSECVFAALFYAVCSSSMAFLNKAVLSAYDFNFPFFILVCQMTVTIIFLKVLSAGDKIRLPSISLKNSAKSFLFLPFSYGLHASFSLFALRGMNIPMYAAMKRCTPLVNLVFTVFILQHPFPSPTITLSVLIITSGCIIAAFGDLTFDPFTYTMGALSVLAQGFYQTLSQKASENHSTLEIMQFNACITLWPFLLCCILAGEPHNIVASPYITDFTFQALFLLLVTLGSVLNYSLYLCTALNTALTTSLVGVAKSTVQTVLGFFVFEGVQYEAWNVGGIALNFVGGILFTYAKFMKNANKVKQKTFKYSKITEHENTEKVGNDSNHRGGQTHTNADAILELGVNRSSGYK